MRQKWWPYPQGPTYSFQDSYRQYLLNLNRAGKKIHFYSKSTKLRLIPTRFHLLYWSWLREWNGEDVMPHPWKLRSFYRKPNLHKPPSSERATQGRWHNQSKYSFGHSIGLTTWMTRAKSFQGTWIPLSSSVSILLPTIKRVSLLETLINSLSAAAEMESIHDSCFCSWVLPLSWVLSVTSLSFLSGQWKGY